MLAYDDPTILSAKAPVQPYFPYLHVDATASVLLFNPVPKTRLGKEQWLQDLQRGIERRKESATAACGLRGVVPM